MNDLQPSSPSPATSLRARLARWLGVAPTSRDLSEAISDMNAGIAALTQATANEQATLAGLQERIERLEKELARTGKEQYKANLLSEAQQKAVNGALDQLRQAETYRDRELVALRNQLTGAQVEGRLEVARQLFPVIDGLDEAFESGKRWLEQIDRHRTPDERASGGRASLFGRLFRALPEPAPDLEVQNRLKSWLDGLDLVLDRLMDILAAQGITPIAAEGEPFDPRWQVAIETAPPEIGQAPGQIVKTQRRGFRLGDAVLRYAEVVVAREVPEATQMVGNRP